MKPRIMLIIGAALLASALVMLLVAEQLRPHGQDVAVLALRIAAAVDGLVGLLFLLLGVRRAGESPP